MKRQFEPDLDYQRAVIDPVTSLFRGQETVPLEFTVSRRQSDSPWVATGLDETCDACAGAAHVD